MKVINDKKRLYLGYLLINITYYSSLPFLAIYLKRLFDLSAINIAVIIISGPICSSLAGVLFGKYCDRHDKNKILLICLCLSVLSYLTITMKQTVIYFLLFNCVVGFFRGLSDMLFKACFALWFSNKAHAFGWRALIINLSAALGAIIGYFYANKGEMSLFIFCAVLQGLAVIILRNVLPRNISKVEPPVNQSWSVLNVREDKAFIYLLIAIILAVACYSQLDSSLPVILEEKITSGTRVFFILLVTNALTAILLQPIVSMFLDKCDWRRAIQYGFMCFLISFLIPVFTFITPALIFMVILFTAAELIVFQAGYIAIDEMSPNHSKSEYYGIANLDTLGSFLGPLIGCGIYQLYNEKVMFLFLCVILVMPAYVFIALSYQAVNSIEQYNRDSAF